MLKLLRLARRTWFSTCFPILTLKCGFASTENSEIEDDKDVDAPNADQRDWQEEEERHFDFVDYDAIDLIELSEQCS
jgi:hypothetical protein